MDQDDLQREVNWRDGVPISSRFDDPYFSFEDGLAETKHVFLRGNGLPDRFRDGFHIAELGFGTGLNALATLAAWRQKGSFRFTSFEAYPMEAEDMARALSLWPDLQSAPLNAAWTEGKRVIEIGPMRLDVIIGDVTKTLPQWDGSVDAWYLDGFSPAKNESMWGEDLLFQVGQHTANGGTCATYSAAAKVRAGLEKAGFKIARVPGFGRKRHMTTGIM